LVLAVVIFTSSFLIDGKVSELIVVSIFILIVVCGYFFNKSTDKIIQANFIQKKAKEELQELSEKLEDKVNEQTKEIKESYAKIEKAYETEKRAHEQLKRLREVENQFMLSTQHHLRSPLTIIQGYLSMINEGAYGRVPAEAKEKIGASLEAAQKLIHLVNDLLDVTHFRMGKGDVPKDFTDTVGLVGEVVVDLEKTAQAKKIYLDFKKPSLSIAPIAIDARGIKEAIYNIIDNAIKYTQKGGVTVSVGAVSQKLVISVADTGIGMNEKDRQGLFGRTFERGEKAKSVNVNGKGIGLYLAAQMIKNNGGTIRVESAGWGKGTEFIIKLSMDGGQAKTPQS
jgi:signal transduction histidine kinase